MRLIETSQRREAKSALFPSSGNSLASKVATVAGLTTRCHDSRDGVSRHWLYSSLISSILVLETSPTVVMADNKKHTTAEILAPARQQNSGGSADSSGDAVGGQRCS